MPDYEGKPIRMRGYYRAVTRGDSWAVKIANLIKKDPLQGLLALVYRNLNFKQLIYAENPFLSMIKRDNGWTGGQIPIPIKK